MKLLVNMFSQNADTPLTAAHGPPYSWMEATSRSRWGISQFLSSPQETRNSPLGYGLKQTKLYKKPYLSESFPPAPFLPLPLSVLLAEESQTWQTPNSLPNRPDTGWWQHPSTTVYTTHCIFPSKAYYRN